MAAVITGATWATEIDPYDQFEAVEGASQRPRRKRLRGAAATQPTDAEHRCGQAEGAGEPVGYARSELRV